MAKGLTMGAGGGFPPFELTKRRFDETEDEMDGRSAAALDL
jgi:hypothetical protein